MNLKLLLPCAAVAAVLSFTGCETTSADNKPVSTVTLALEPGAKKATATMRFGEELKIELTAPGNADLVWELVSNDTQVLKQTSAFKFTPAASGVGGVSTISFFALRGGRTTLRFAYLRPGARETEPVDTYDIVVTIKT